MNRLISNSLILPQLIDFLPETPYTFLHLIFSANPKKEDL
jgi:hypothetical protein